MSGAIGAGVGGGGLRALLIANAATARDAVDRLTAQSGSGKVATTFGGLAAGQSKVSLDLRGAVAHQDAVVAGITHATGTIGVAQAALKQITSIASDLQGKLSGVNSLDPGALDSLGSWARDALQQVATLLDTTDAGTYVFGGTDSANPPVPDPQAIGTSGFATGIAAAVSSLGAAGATATLGAVRAVATSNASPTSPFSVFLNAAATAGADVRTTVETGDGGASGARVPAGIVANVNADATSSVSAGSSGSYVRDILASLAAVGALNASHANDPGLVGFATGTLATVEDAIGAAGVDAGALGDRQTVLTTHATDLAASRTAMESQISGIEDVDLVQTATNLAAAQTQLQASYKLIASVNSLSLVSFL